MCTIIFQRIELPISDVNMGSKDRSSRSQVSQSPRGIIINQAKYALETLKKYGMDLSDPVDTPMVDRLKLDEDLMGIPVDQTRFRGMNTMAEQNVPTQPPTRTDEQIVPRSQWLIIGKSNLLFNAQKIQKNPIFQISVDILSNTNFFRAFTASANVPAIYLQQFWNTMKYDEKTGEGFYLRDPGHFSSLQSKSQSPSEEPKEKEISSFVPKGERQYEVSWKAIPEPMITEPSTISKGKPTFQLVDEDDEAQQESIPQEEGDDPDLELAKKMSLEAHQEKGEGEGDDADMERAIKLSDGSIPFSTYGRCTLLEDDRSGSTKTSTSFLIDWSKKKRTTDQFILVRRDQTPHDSTTGPSSQPEDDTSEKVIHESSSTSDSERTERTRTDDALIKILENDTTADLMRNTCAAWPRVYQESKNLKRAKVDYQNQKGTRNPANYHLYHALIEALIADEDAMDKKLQSSNLLPQHPALTSTGWQITNTRDVVVDSSMHRSDPESEHSEQSSDDIPMQDEGHVSDLEDTDNAHIPKVSTTTWFKPIPEGERPATPEPEWTIPPNDFPEPENNWANTYATTYQVPAENKLQRKTYDIGSFIKWFCRRTGKKKLCKADLEGPAFNLVKAFHKNNVFLQFQMDECHKLLTNKVDLVNPEGHQILRNIYEPLPLGGPPGQVTIQPQFFFNKDLDYLLTGDKERKIALSISKLKAARYLDFGLEELVPSLWVESERDYDISAAYGITHWWFRRKEFYINKHSEPSDREAVRSQMRILSVISVKDILKDGDGDDTCYDVNENHRPQKGVKASANSDIMYFFTSAQDGDPLYDDVRLCLGDDLKKAQDHN
ncbi:hypothetical protein Tco_0007013 [Tanacetum coccineum]